MTTNIKTFTAGSGVESIVEIDDKIYINTSGGGAGVSSHGDLTDLLVNDHPQYILNSDFIASGFATESSLHTSGYIRNVDFVQSGYQTAAELTASGVRSDTVNLGSADQFDGLTELTISTLDLADRIILEDVSDGGAKKRTVLGGIADLVDARLHTSGFIRNADLIGSGYVENLNGLTADIVIAGSGKIQVWEDGQTVQIGTTAASLQEVQDDLHASGYIRNVDFVSSGFQTAAQLASSGLITRDIMNTSGYITRDDVHASGYVRQTDIVGSGDIDVWVDGNTVQIGYVDTGGGSGTERLTWTFTGAVPSGGMSGVDGARYIDVEHHITNIFIWSNSPSGNVIATISSGAPDTAPVGMYTGEAEPTASGSYGFESGSMPNTRIIPANMLLYCDIQAGSPGLLSSGLTVELLLARSS